MLVLLSHDGETRRAVGVVAERVWVLAGQQDTINAHQHGRVDVTYSPSEVEVSHGQKLVRRRRVAT